MAMLPDCLEHPEFSSLDNYLKAQESLKRFQLAERIADTFDQYLLFRPEMISDWEKGKEDHWQAILWRRLIEGKEKQHRAALGKIFLEKLKTISDKELVPRIAVFGISALPKFYVQFFAALSEMIQVNLFLMNPCAEYWGDILTRREIRRISAKAVDTDDLYLWQGNSLLSSMGTMGRDFFDLINEFNPQDYPSFEEPGQDSLLACIQSDILNLIERSDKVILADDDISIQIHSCHSPMREIQVLQDQLLDMFEHDPELNPADILVMTPDIGAYSPYIQAVFDLPADDPCRIPFSIADQSMRQESRIIDIFLQILDLWGSRFKATEIMDILEAPAVYEKFDLAEDDVNKIRRWVKDTRIRWGIDAQHRASFDLPDFTQNTWKAGIERLLLGYAMPGYDEKLFEGILPYDHIEGNEALSLGNFVEFIHRLFSAINMLEAPRTLSDWADILKQILDEFFKSDEGRETELQAIRNCLNTLEQMQNLAEFDEKTDIHVIKSYLSNRLQKEGFGFGFITGGITFCAMLPMRSIPFKVICLIGMNNDAYPRQSKRPGFDLIAKHPKPGDRSRRNDDRYLFLESLLSARKTFYLSFVGQSVQDNSMIPPSVLVSELIDYIEKNFEFPEKNIIDDHLLTKHRLQAFSPKYFEECKVQNAKCKMFSFSQENFEAAKRLITPGRKKVQFISKELSEPEQEWKTVDIADLCSFFTHPARFLLNRRLNLYLEDDAELLEEKEAFDLKGLEKYLLNENLLEKRLKGYDLDDFFAIKTAAGELPHGTVGECTYRQFGREVECFADKVQPLIRAPLREAVDVNLDIADFRIVGSIEGIYGNRLIRFRYAKLKPKDRLRLWIYHLSLNMTQEISSLLVGSDHQIEYAPMPNAKDILEMLLLRYWQGLKTPLHFFPQSSMAYAEAVIIKGKSEKEAEDAALYCWIGNEHNRGESDDLYYQRCFRHENPLDAAFRKVSIEIFEDILTQETKI
jgi:exodeoxyribonuclease V gamma subunit